VLGIELNLLWEGARPSPLSIDGSSVLSAALNAAMPDTAVKKALEALPKTAGKLLLLAVGKAAWQMAKAAYDCLGEEIHRGMVITKHGYAMGAIGNLVIREAGHPVPDKDTYAATEEALVMTENLTEQDRVLFLLSGGGSALFEKPLLPREETEAVTKALLACGAEITEINIIRKRFSGVKGGKFAQHVFPASVFSVILSDIIGDPVDMIASGPAYPDSSTAEDALSIAKKYALPLSEAAWALLNKETPKELSNVKTLITGSVRELCLAAEKECIALGYEAKILTDTLSCEARRAGARFAALAKEYAGKGKRAFIMGGETVVKLKGNGKGGRNQEMALAAAIGMEGIRGVWFGAMGSDGTDGPTDAAGGCADGETVRRMLETGVDAVASLENNDAYHALQATGNLLFTGPTGTNVNDVAVLLID
jgi:hydroxypyruvate reductase